MKWLVGGFAVILSLMTSIAPSALDVIKDRITANPPTNHFMRHPLCAVVLGTLMCAGDPNR